MRGRYAVYLVAFFLVFGGVYLAGKRTPSGPVTRILFIGNSFTYVHGIPDQFESIAESKGKHVDVRMAAEPNESFREHLNDSRTLNAIVAEPWDYVVLQEQSMRFSLDNDQVARESKPDARELAAYVRQHAPTAKIVFYETWADTLGYSDCDDPNYCSYAAVQQRLIFNYHAIARELQASVAPVGEVWQQMRAHHPEIILYKSDGHHQSDAGAYLAACTFFRTLFHENVTGADRNAMSAGDAAAIQQEVDHLYHY